MSHEDFSRLRALPAEPEPGISSAITDEAVREALRGMVGEPIHGD